MEWIIIPIVTVLGMIAGQKFKQLRRFGIPIASLTVAIKKKKYRAMALLLLGVFLSMGYGENSKFYKWTGGRKWLIRLIYGFLVGLPVAIAGFYWSLIIMPLGFVIRFPFSFKIGKYDFLWQDFFTYSLLGGCIYMVLR
jgi:hypothetical protein